MRRVEYARERLIIAAPIGRVWAVVSAFGAMESWCPAIKAMTLEGHGIGSIRTAYLEGVASREQLLEVDAERHRIGYALLEPGALPLRNIRSTLTLATRAAEATEVEWWSEADQAPPETIRAVGEIVAGFYRENLATLKTLLEAERVVRPLF